MKANPPVQSYKALLWDYDYLLEKSDEECCYSFSEREVQIMLAIVDYIGWKTRYKPTDTEINQPTINKWMGNLSRKLMSGCCPDDDAIHRFNEDGVYQTSTDGGLTWEDDPDNDPRNDYVAAPPLPGTPGFAKQCAAADNVRDLFIQYRDNLIDLLTAGSGLIAIVAGILAFLAVITGISGAAIGISVLLMGLATALLSETPASVAAQIDAIALETFKCLVYCRMNQDGQITYTNWLGLLDDISTEFTGFPETFFYQTVNGMGYIGITNAGTIGASTASDCDDCDCFDGCGDPDNFTFGIVNSRTENPDGSVTFEVSSEAAPDTTQVVAWKQYTLKTECCEILEFTIHTTGGTPEFYFSFCSDNEGTYNVNFNFPGGCMFFAQVIQNFALTTPFTATVRIGAACT